MLIELFINFNIVCNVEGNYVWFFSCRGINRVIR